jgi:AraC-like DNA-binding protein
MSETPFRRVEGKSILPGGDGPAPEGFVSLILVKAGILGIRAMGRIVSVQSGSAAIFPPAAPFRPEKSCGVQSARVDFARSALDIEYLASSSAWLLSLLYPTPHPPNRAILTLDSGGGEKGPVVIKLGDREFIEAWSIMARLRSTLADGQASERGMERLRLAELAMIVSAGGPSSSAHARQVSFSADEVIAYVRERSSEELRLQDIAERFGVNPSYLSRAFASRAGLPLFEYLNRTRISKACALLKRSSMSVLEISYAVGYNNLSHFNRVFKRLAGVSPREFRRKNARA